MSKMRHPFDARFCRFDIPAGAVQDDGLPTVERLARAFHVLAAKHTGLEESDYDDEDYAYFRQQAEETLEALRAAPPLHDPQEPLDPAGANNGPTWHNEPKDGWRP